MSVTAATDFDNEDSRETEALDREAERSFRLLDDKLVVNEYDSDWGLLSNLLRTFMASRAKNESGLEQAILKDDHHTFREIGHRVKGSALQLGLCALGRVAAQIERMGRTMHNFVKAEQNEEEGEPSHEEMVRAEEFYENRGYVLTLLSLEYDRVSRALPVLQQCAEDAAHSETPKKVDKRVEHKEESLSRVRQSRSRPQSGVSYRDVSVRPASSGSTVKGSPIRHAKVRTENLHSVPRRAVGTGSVGNVQKWAGMRSSGKLAKTSSNRATQASPSAESATTTNQSPKTPKSSSLCDAKPVEQPSETAAGVPGTEAGSDDEVADAVPENNDPDAHDNTGTRSDADPVSDDNSAPYMKSDEDVLGEHTPTPEMRSDEDVLGSESDLDEIESDNSANAIADGNAAEDGVQSEEGEVEVRADSTKSPVSTTEKSPPAHYVPSARGKKGRPQPPTESPSFRRTAPQSQPKTTDPAIIRRHVSRLKARRQKSRSGESFSYKRTASKPSDGAKAAANGTPYYTHRSTPQSRAQGSGGGRDQIRLLSQRKKK